MNQLKVGENKLMVNCDSKTKEYLNNWIEEKKQEWLNQQKGLEKEVNLEELEEKERNNQIMPWIEELIGQYAGDIQAKFQEILGSQGEQNVGPMTSIDYRSATTLDQARRYKPHIKEIERENRFLELEKDKIQKYERLRRNWEAKEIKYEEAKLKEKQKEARREADLQELIKRDLEYDPHEDKYHSSCPYFSKSSKEKKRERRKREAQLDEKDRLREIQEIKEEEERKIEEEKKRIEELKREEERKNRAQTRFTEISKIKKEAETPSNVNKDVEMTDVNNQNQQLDPNTPQPLAHNASFFPQQNSNPGMIPLRMPNQMNPANLPPPPPMPQAQTDVPQPAPAFNPPPPPPQMHQRSEVAAQFKEAVTEDIEGPATLLKTEDSTLNENLAFLEQKRKQIEEEAAKKKQEAEQQYEEEDREELIKKLKEIYQSLPKKDDEILAFNLNWDGLISLNVIEVIIRKIIGRRVKEILNVEEENLIQFVIEELKKKVQPKDLKKKLKKVLDEEAGQFVTNVWRAMIFESIKIEKDIIRVPFALY
mmetsp:Transcript_3194/g.2912  ORF Transcript_3194/g.2912 Transcript_3194/m.2912 type:complete len:537 (-) Transcript_3194:45-1655(-)